MPLRPVNGANQAHSRRQASERKSYQLTLHQDKRHQQSYYCITEMKVATGQKKMLPSKWQQKPSSRTPLHRIHQPAKSILRRVNDTSVKAPRSPHSEGSLRFSNGVDRRFYIIGSASSEQLVKLILDGSVWDAEEKASPGTIDLVEIASSPEPCNDGIEELIDAVKTGSTFQNIITMLQEDVDRSQQDPSLPEDWLTSLYYSIKQQKTETNPLRGSNLERVFKVLSIYKNAEGTINAARALKQWSRFEVTVESISNLRMTGDALENEPFTAEMNYSSDKAQQMVLGKLPPAEVSSHVNYTGRGARRYCLNHNFGSEDERPQLTLRLHQGEFSLGSVVLPCSIFRYFSTQPTKTYNLEREIHSDGCLDPGAKVKFSIRKVPLKPEFLHAKRREITERIHDLVSWVCRFNKEIA